MVALYPITATCSLSLSDRAYLALGLATSQDVYTAERARANELFDLETIGID